MEKEKQEQDQQTSLPVDDDVYFFNPWDNAFREEMKSNNQEFEF